LQRAFFYDLVARADRRRFAMLTAIGVLDFSSPWIAAKRENSPFTRALRGNVPPHMKW
jgi:hypothetical protein